MPILRKYLDASIVGLNIYLAIQFYDPDAWDARYLTGALLSVLTFFLIGEMSGLYRRWNGAGLIQELGHVATVWLGTLLVMLLTAYAFKITGELSRIALGIWFIATPLLLGLWRILRQLLLRSLRRHGYSTHAAAIAGADETGVRIARVIDDPGKFGFRLDGFYDDREQGRLAFDGEKKGDFKTLVERAKKGDIDTVYITLPIMAEDRIRYLIEELADTTASVYMVPDFFISNVLQGRWTNFNEMEVVSVYDTPFAGVEGIFKRGQDIVFSSLLLILLALPMLAIALGVRLSSPGPVLFKQRRYGLDGKEILVWKFRSMRVCEDGGVIQQAQRNDPRVTPFGAFLRRTSLDELPQFINVFMGEMSIVGPRPHAVAHNEQYRELIRGYMLRHKVKPGITGWAQVNGWRGETDDLEKMRRRVEHDLWYMRNWSFWLDMKIFFMTIYQVLFSQRAY
ncbi:MAG: undecaprenyl-phosphate glucose phosphotransferase [Gammaproteobacteria bacterium]|nr:undecaprenyl-phosphate glucose phosphotransferase [Gammaproteobacteria bacterium]MBU1653381.1 undecaprenyl-phosphate glucose phosphotransferase [Gammaproteobacteria bacterium]MBU1960834.1 undecaprenyl-phosphate glucose phosphotransferase [Gammaproteobacteria bacterium]